MSGTLINRLLTWPKSSMVLFCMLTLCITKRLFASELYNLHNRFCSLTDPLTILSQFDTLHAITHPHQASSHYGPHNLRVCIVTYITKDILPYSQYSLLINGFYSSLYEYDFYVVYPETVTSYKMDLDAHDARWNKVKLLYDAIATTDSWGSHCDYIMWVDADWIVLDMKWSITELVSSNSLAHIIVSAEHSGSTTMMNSGSILVRNSAWSRSFLWDWWTIADRRMFSDQEQFDMLYQRRQQQESNQKSFPSSNALNKKVIILPPEVMNSDPPAMTQLLPSHQVLHLMGEENQYREAVFQTAWSAICQSVSQFQFASETVDIDIYMAHLLSTVPHQLNITQPVLLVKTIIIYGQLLEKKLAPYISCLSRDKRDTKSDISTAEAGTSQKQQQQAQCSRVHSLETCRTWSNIVHHYIHALDHYVRHIDISSVEQKQHLLSSQSILLSSILQSSSSSFSSSDDDDSSNQQHKANETITNLGQQLRYKLYQVLQWQLELWHQYYQLPSIIRDSSLDSTQRQHRSPLSLTPSSIPKDYPEFVKTVAIAAQHLVPIQNKATLTLSERIHIADEIELYLERLLEIAHQEQHPAIQQMAIHHLLQEGEIALQELLNIAAAKTCFEGAVKIARDIASVFGRHHLIQPLIMAANVHALEKDFPSAMRLYEEAAGFARDVWGPWHLSLAQLYYNYARACLESNDIPRARQLLQNIESIVQMHHRHQQHDHQQLTSTDNIMAYFLEKLDDLRHEMINKK